MSRLLILASVVALAAGSANCADDPGQTNSIGSIVPSGVIAASSDETFSMLAKGGKPALIADESTIVLVLLDSTDGVPHFGQHVTFDVTTTATDDPIIMNRCYQNDSLVSQETLRVDPENSLYSRTFTLGPSPAWTGGGADCTADLVTMDSFARTPKTTVIKTLPYTVEP
jgi:hypothetical protein